MLTEDYLIVSNMIIYRALQIQTHFHLTSNMAVYLLRVLASLQAS